MLVVQFMVQKVVANAKPWVNATVFHGLTVLIIKNT